MKRNRKIIVGSAIATATAAAVAAGFLLNPLTTRAEEYSRLYGVQQVVNNMEDSDFNILEIVPDTAYSSFGYLVSGQEPGIDDKLLSSLNSYAERQQAVTDLLTSVNTGRQDSVVTFDSTNDYTEQLYTPATDDLENWATFNLGGVQELRTGRYELASDHGLSTGDYYYSPKINLSLEVYSVTRSVGEGDDKTTTVVYDSTDETQKLSDVTVLPGDVVRYCLRVENYRSSEWQYLTLKIRSEVAEGVTAPAVTGVDPDAEGEENVAWDVEEGAAATVTIASLADTAREDLYFDYTVSGTAGTSVDFYVDSSISYYDAGNTSQTSTYISDGVMLTYSEEAASSESDESVTVIGKFSTVDKASVRVQDLNDYMLNAGSTSSTYIWVDTAADAEGAVAAYVYVDKVYYKVNASSTNLFPLSVLNLIPATSEKANDGDLFSRIHVYSMTPTELQAALANNELTIGNLDLVYISNSSIFGSSSVFTSAVSAENSAVSAYGSDNDITEETADNIFAAVRDVNLPVIVDYSVVTLPTTTDGTTLNISKLAKDLLDDACYTVDSSYSGTYVNGTYIDGAGNAYASYGVVGESVFVNYDAAYGNSANGNINKTIFAYVSSGSDTGNTRLLGMSDIINEIETDNFYNQNNDDNYTSEYSVSGDVENINISGATLIKYILNYADRRVVLYKDSIKVLDLEPTKYSTLSEETVRSWLGISDTYEFTTGTSNIKATVTTNSQKLKLTSNDSENDSWTVDNTSVASVSGTGKNAVLTAITSGTVTVTHRYGHDAYRDEGSWENKHGKWNWNEGQWHDASWTTETITVTITKNSAEDSKIKTIDIVQMSTSEYIGKLEDLIETYDMIYIGSCIGPAYANGSLYQSNGVTTFNDSSMNGSIYFHVGDIAVSTDLSLRGLLNIEGNGATYVQSRYSGNDITSDKYDELVEYAEAGYPIVVDDKFYTSEGEVDTTYLDNSSYLYKLINGLGDGYVRTKTIQKTDYEAAVTEYGSETAAAAYGYTKQDNSTYTYTYSHNVANTTNTLTKVTDLSTLSADKKYVLICPSTLGNVSYLMVKGSDITTYGTEFTKLMSSSTTEVETDTDLSADCWTITKNSSGKYAFKNASGEYLYLPSSNGTYVELQDDASYMSISSSDKFSNAFFISIKPYDHTRYLNCRGSQPGTYNSADRNSSWWIFEYTPASGTYTETVTVNTTEAAYNAAVNAYGSVEAANNAGYVKNEDIKYYLTYTKTALPNLIKGNIDGKLATKLAKYINMPRLNLVVIDQPLEYSSETDANGNLTSATYLEKEDGRVYMDYEFEFSNSAESGTSSTTYTVQLYVDINADGRYADAEELDGLDVYENGTLVNSASLKSDTRYTLRRELPSDYVGLLPWKLVISMNTADGSESTVRDSAIGYTAVEATDTTVIKVLQIMPYDNALDLTKDPFKHLIESVEGYMHYDLQITTITVDNLVSTYQTNRSKYTSGDDYYNKYLSNYDMLIFGFADGYGYKDISEQVIVDGISSFIDSGKSVLFSHDLTSFNNGYYSGGTSGWGYHVNQYLRSAAGMDRFGITEDNLDFLTCVSDYQKYAATSNQLDLIENNEKDAASASVSGNTTYLYAETQGFTSNFLDRMLNTSKTSQYDVYGSYNMNSTTVSQENEGQITLYPFDVTIEATDTTTNETYSQRRVSYSSDSDYYVEQTASMSVAQTHGQYYQLDFNYDTDNDGKNNLVVWYNLSSGYYNYVPNDCRNNYYIYSVGNITYTGMGHDNTASDISLAEAKLFVNTIVAAYSTGKKDPSVNITESTSSKNSSLSTIYTTFDTTLTKTETEAADAETETQAADAETTTVEEGLEEVNLDGTYEDFAFYVNDVNIIQGTKTVHVIYCYEVTAREYQAAITAGTEGYYTTKDDDNNTVYLKQFTASEIGSVLYTHAANETTGKLYSTAVSNNRLVEVQLRNSWIQTCLGKDKTVTYTNEDGTTVEETLNPDRLWIGAYSTLDYSSENKSTENTNLGFDYVTFKKRTLIDLD